MPPLVKIATNEETDDYGLLSRVPGGNRTGDGPRKFLVLDTLAIERRGGGRRLFDAVVGTGLD